jgi:hypothetical protein
MALLSEGMSVLLGRQQEEEDQQAQQGPVGGSARGEQQLQRTGVVAPATEAGKGQGEGGGGGGGFGSQAAAAAAAAGGNQRAASTRTVEP